MFLLKNYKGLPACIAPAIVPGLNPGNGRGIAYYAKHSLPEISLLKLLITFAPLKISP
jgi:hypothetical protein